MSSSFRLGLPVVAIALALATPVAALAAGADDTAAAREHYQRGTAYYDLGRYQDAIKEFEAAYEIKSDPALLYNLAQSHRLAGNAEQALHFYRTYLRRVPKAPNKAEIEGRITALEQQLAQKTGGQTTPPPVGGGTGTGTGTTGTGTGTGTQPPPPPDTGTGAGTGTGTGVGMGTTGGGTTPPPLPPNLPPPNGTAPGGMVMTSPPPPAASGRARTLQMVGIGGAALGGVLILVGLVEGVRAAGAANDINNAAKAGGTFDPAVEARGKSAEHWEAGLLITGVLVGAGGGIIYYLGRREGERQAATVAIVPTATPEQVGGLVRVRF